jgi:hypothetical protein
MEYQVEDGERSGGRAGNGMCLLYGQATNRYFIALVEGMGRGVVYKAGL